MRTPNWTTCTEGQLWRYVAWHLARRGIPTVLVGGAAASIYSEGAYRSGDLDLVPIGVRPAGEMATAMAEIGFASTGGRHFRHPKCKHLFVEFVSPPVAIGDDLRIVPRTLRAEKWTIQLLNPTDCVRDRLASYIHFRARECLDQAVLVARRNRVNLVKIRNWCAGEGGAAQYQEFAAALRRPRRSGSGVEVLRPE